MKMLKKAKKYQFVFYKRVKKLYKRIVRFVKIKKCDFKQKFIILSLKSIPIETKILSCYYRLKLEVKSCYLAYKSLITTSSILLQMTYLFIVFFISLVIFHCSQKYADYQSILYTLLGAVLSMYVTVIFTVGSHLLKAVRYLTLMHQDITSMLNCTDAVFVNFFSYPLRDEFCVRGDNIIYIRPMKAGGGYDEDELINYTDIINNLSYSDFCKYLDEKRTRFLMNQLKNQSFSFNNTYLTVLHRQDLIDKKCFLLFSQFHQSLMAFLYKDSFRWEDEQIKYSLYLIFQILIYKMSMSIIILQKELSKYEKYINYISKQPEINRQHYTNYMNQKVERLKNNYIDKLSLVSNTPKKEWDLMFKEELKSVQEEQA